MERQQHNAATRAIPRYPNILSQRGLLGTTGTYSGARNAGWERDIAQLRSVHRSVAQTPHFTTSRQHARQHGDVGISREQALPMRARLADNKSQTSVAAAPHEPGPQMVRLLFLHPRLIACVFAPDATTARHMYACSNSVCQRNHTKMESPAVTSPGNIISPDHRGPAVDISIWIFFVLSGLAVVSKVLTKLARASTRVSLRKLQVDDFVLSLTMVRNSSSPVARRTRN